MLFKFKASINTSTSDMTLNGDILGNNLVLAKEKLKESLAKDFHVDVSKVDIISMTTVKGRKK